MTKTQAELIETANSYYLTPPKSFCFNLTDIFRGANLYNQSLGC